MSIASAVVAVRIVVRVSAFVSRLATIIVETLRTAVMRTCRTLEDMSINTCNLHRLI